MIANHLKKYVIHPTLEMFELGGKDAENLLLGTAAQESHMGEYLHQLGNGPALGIYQIEPHTHDDIWDNYLVYRTDLREHVNTLLNSAESKYTQLVTNLSYATIIARLVYYRVPEPLPTNKAGYAEYWKKYYNTELGKGTEAEFLMNYERYL